MNTNIQLLQTKDYNVDIKNLLALSFIALNEISTNYKITGK